jgi:GGDEF domain-containing protein
MGFRTALIYHSPRGRPAPADIEAFTRAQGLRLIEESTRDGVIAHVHRGFPACIVMDPSPEDASCVELCGMLKRDPFTAVVPIVVLYREGGQARVHEALEAGADEVITERMDATEQALRLKVTLQRADRDVSVNPTTRLPGTAQIERDITDRIQHGTMFAVCYADLDHFKEFNDRYGYDRGDGVIQLLSRILRDIVKELSPSGFIGHIGGDDFIFTLPLDDMPRCCEEIIDIFDELVPYQYSEADRKAGHFLGKDRRGNIYRIPLMTLSIGVVTNEHRRLTHYARVSELATEMKTYAKTLPGSVFAIDRRRDEPEVSREGDDRRIGIVQLGER